MGKSTWKYNKLLTGRRNYFWGGGPFGNQVFDWYSRWRDNLSIEDKVFLESLGDPIYKPVSSTPNIEGYNYADRTPLGAPSTTSPTDEATVVIDDNYTENHKNNGVNISDIGGALGSIGAGAGVLAKQLGTMITKINAKDVKSTERNILARASSNVPKAIPTSFNQYLADYNSFNPTKKATKEDYGYSNPGAIVGNALAQGVEGAAAGYGVATGGLFGEGSNAVSKKEDTSTNSAAYGGQFERANKYLAGGPIGAIVGGAVGVTTSLVGDLIRNHKINKSLGKVNDNISWLNDYSTRSFLNSGNALMSNQLDAKKASYRAFGGPIGEWDGAIGYQFTNDWLNNKQLAAENKGTYNSMMLPRLNSFADGGEKEDEINPGLDAMVKARLALDSHFGNPTARRMTNYDTRSYTFDDGRVGNVYVGSYDNYVTPHIQEVDGELKLIEEPWSRENWKRSEEQSMKFESPRDAEYFANNYKRFAPMMNIYKALGGNLMTHGADWDTRLMAINAGGSHESNPYEGVPMGVDQQGTPNLVEEGETIFNDYVFSKRLMVPEWFRKKYKLGGKISFADASKKLARESEERPNDPISQNGLEALMMDLANAQEEYKARQREKEEAQMFALGGRVNKFAGTNPWTPSKIRSYKGLGNSYYGFGDTPFWIVDGKYSDDYRNYINSDNYNADVFRQHLKDQFAYYDDPNVDKNSNRYKAIDYFIKSNPDWYNNRESIDSWNIDSKLMKQVKKLALSNPGFMHPEKAAAAYLGANGNNGPQDFHRLKKPDGTYTDMPEEAYYYSVPDEFFDPLGYQIWKGKDYDFTPWEEKWKDKYQFLNMETDADGNSIYWYNPVTGDGSTGSSGSPNSPAANTGTGKNRYYWLKDGQKVLLGDDYLDVITANKLKEKSRIAQPDNSEFYDYIYEVQKELPPLEKSPFEKTRGLWSLLNNGIQFGISAFNGPDLSNADAMLEAVRNPGEVTEISPDLIGNYIKYKPFDIERGINALNSQLGAGIRSLANTSSGNRGTLQAGVLAALNNANNQTGNMYRQAMEYNRADEFKTYEANKDTDKFNAEAKRAVALANQSTRANARSSMLNGLLTAYAARQNAIDNYNQGLTVNLNSIAETLENKAYEDKMANLAKWYIENGGKPGTETLFAAKGGKLKRVKRKGLTF